MSNQKLSELEIWIDLFLKGQDTDKIHKKNKYKHSYRTADIAKKLVSGKKLKFDFKRPKDNYAKYLWKGKSHYKDESKFIFVVRADIKFRDVEASKEAGKDIFRVVDEEFEVPRWRARDLENKKLVTIIDKIDPDLK